MAQPANRRLLTEATAAGLFVTWAASEEEADQLPPGTLALILGEPPGANYSTDFSEYTTGSRPSDWALAWRKMGTWAVVDDAAATGGKVLRYTSTIVSTNRHGLVWSAIAGDEHRADVETLVRFRLSSVDGIRPLVRGGDPGEWVGPVGYAYGSDGGELRITQLDPAMTLSAVPMPVPANAWWWVRSRTVGSVHKVRMWADGTTEPDTWSEAISSASADPGHVGLYVGAITGVGNTADVDYFSVATGGRTAV